MNEPIMKAPPILETGQRQISKVPVAWQPYWREREGRQWYEPIEDEV